jgi:hypothetical protein
MCNCLAWHPLWSTVARAAKVRRSTVVAVLFVLREAPDLPLARSDQVVAETLEARLDVIARVTAALRAAGVVDLANCPLPGWGVTLGDAAVTLGDAAVTLGDGVTLPVTLSVTLGAADRLARRRFMGRLRMARCRARARGLAPSLETAVAGYPPSYAPSPSDAGLEEERDQIILSEERGARARDPRHVKREALMHRGLGKARLLLRPRAYDQLIAELTERGRYEAFLDHGSGALPKHLREFFETMFAVTAPGAGEVAAARASPHQTSLFLPMAGGGARPGVTASPSRVAAA